MEYAELDPDPWDACAELTIDDGALLDFWILGIAPKNLAGIVNEMVRRTSPYEVTEHRIEDVFAPVEDLGTGIANLIAGRSHQLSINARLDGIQFSFWFERNVDDPSTISLLMYIRPLDVFPQNDAASRRARFADVVQFGLDLCESGAASRLLVAPGDFCPRESRRVIWERDS